MKILIELKPLTDYYLGFNYNYNLSSALYNKLDTSEIENLHDGLPSTWTFHLDLSRCSYSRRGFKLTNNVCLIVSSSDERIIKHLEQSFLESPLFKVGVHLFMSQDYRILDDTLNGNVFVFQTVTPINVVKKERGRKEETLHPADDSFTEQLVKNMMQKSSVDNDNISVEVVRDTIRPKLVKLKGEAKMKAYHFIFLVRGDRQVVQESFSRGFGRRNAQGFGMVKVLKKDTV